MAGKVQIFQPTCFKLLKSIKIIYFKHKKSSARICANNLMVGLFINGGLTSLLSIAHVVYSGIVDNSYIYS